MKKQDEYFIVNDNNWYLHLSRIINFRGKIKHNYMVLTIKKGAATFTEEVGMPIVKDLNEKYDNHNWKLELIKD